MTYSPEMRLENGIRKILLGINSIVDTPRSPVKFSLCILLHRNVKVVIIIVIVVHHTVLKTKVHYSLTRWRPTAL